MEITNIKENMISPSPQGSIPGRVGKSKQPEEQAGRSEAAKELLKKVSRGDSEAIKGMTDEAAKGLAEKVNQAMKALRYNIQFVVDREAGGVVIKIVDSEDNLIRRIPPEVMASFSSETGMDLGLLLNVKL